MERFKSLTSQRYIAGVRVHGWHSFSVKLWQRRYPDRIIRNETELNKIRTYICNNPIDWAAASVFMFTEPLLGWREAHVHPSRTKIDWALELELLCTRYAEAEKVLLVSDNLNTHTRGAFYEAFEAAKARKIVQRIEFHYTPKHGSWLNISENELSCMTRRCIAGRRIPDIETFRQEIEAWASYSNQKQRGVDWQFTIDKARSKLKALYPKILI